MNPPPDDTHVLPVCDLTVRPMLWLWPGRLALGKLSLLEGDPGLGKSLVTLDLCARLSRGLPFPDGAPAGPPCNTLVLNAEDGEADTVRSRLVALGADLRRVFVLPSSALEANTLRLPSRLDLLESALTHTHARMLVLDPLLAFLDANVASGNDQSVRRALTPLASLAARHDCVFWMVRHLNKRGGSQAIYRGGGAIGLVGACRSAWLVGRDPALPGQCVLAQVKNNLAAPQASLAYRVIAKPDGPIELSWLGPSPWNADQLSAPGSRGLVRAQARAFLHSFLQSGPRPVRDIWTEAQKQGLAARTLHRAKHDLAIRGQRVTSNGVHQQYWLLPGQVLPTPPTPEPGPDDLEHWLAPLREKYPSATPLDEND